MKPESPFSKLPSLSELIQHPTVQSVVERVNQTTIAQRATGFLEELQASWKEPGHLPSVGELAERLAHRLLGRADHCSPTVNATGVVCSQSWQAPLSDASVKELQRYASDFQQNRDASIQRVTSTLAKLAGAEAAWVASNFSAAMCLTEQCPEATLASSPLMGLLNPVHYGYEHVETIGDRIQAGDDLVVVDGSGLLGGPRCGIIFGKRSLIDQVQQSELQSALAADAMTLSTLESTLAVYRTPEQILHQIPLWQLLSAPLQNLQQRCHRIAPLLADGESIATAEPIELESAWLDDGESQLSSKSWAIAVQPTDGNVQQLAKQFENAAPQIIPQVTEGKLQLNFRSIFPRWDQHLISAIE